MEYKEGSSFNKYWIADDEDRIIRCEQVLGGRGESSIIRYY